MEPDQVTFGIHKSLLCNVSSYFNAALNGNYIEATESVIVLLDEKSEVFRRFNEWLYTHEVLQGVLSVNGKTDNWSILFDLYIFAEKRGIPRLQNAVVDAVIITSKVVHAMPACQLIARLWENIPEKS